MGPEWIYHNSHDNYYRNPFGAVTTGQKISLKLLVCSDKVNGVFLRYRQEGNTEQELTMDLAEVRKGDKIFEADFYAPPQPGWLWYYFVVVIDDFRFYYGNNLKCFGGVGGIYENIPPAYQITVFKEDRVIPQWFKEAVVYQIFVDRFYNGCPDGKVLNPKPGSLIHAHWDDTPFYIFDKKTGEIIRWNFFGGNLSGVRKKLAYLRSLGVKAIYLNPVFEAPSNHKYDTGDYHKIDPMFGDNQLFQELCTEAGEMGIAVILDGVFSHTGSDSIYFNKYGRYDSIGAFQSKDSPYFNWYRFSDYPWHFESWWGIDTLPNVNEMDPGYQDFIIFGENSVLKKWMGKGVAGWRLDVADELPDEFIQNFKKTMREVNRESILIGEVWEDASHKESYGKKREYLLGDELDSVTNYPFRNIAFSFIEGLVTSREAGQALMSLCENYPPENFYSILNLIGSHDVPRALTVIKNILPDKSDKDRLSVGYLKLLVLWQMTFPGVPLVYYGDEAGLAGGEDPFNRGPYPWGKENKDLLNWYKRAIALRNHYDVLKTGHWQPVDAPEDIFSFVRTITGEKDVFGQPAQNNTALVFLNRNREQTVNLSLEVSEWCSGKLFDALQDYRGIDIVDGRINLSLAPLEGKVLLQDRWASNAALFRECGVLLHPTSLPSEFGIGDFGRGAHDFIDFLAAGRQKLWQILPLNPPGCGNSPYQCFSAFAGNYMLIDPEQLAAEGLLNKEQLQELPAFDETRVDFDKVKAYKEGILKTAYQSFQNKPNPEYESFVREQGSWLEDYALYMALKEHFQGLPWNKWDQDIRNRENDAIAHYSKVLSEAIGFHKFVQFKFFAQWLKLKKYANSKGIKIIGDLPIFVAQDSSDVWVAPHQYRIDNNGCPISVAGVPPDYFCAEGQCWGNPIYNWDEMKKDNYKWWVERFRNVYQLVDVVRIDHFRGFEGYWEIPGTETTGVNGKWVQGPGEPFFKILQEELGELPVVAEDLGVITAEVTELRERFNFPGMKIMQFELEAGEFKLPLSEKHTVLYTGTHDNDTMLGWYENKYREVLNLGDNGEEICWHFIEKAYSSDAETVIIPLQDILSLDSSARMNTPGTVDGNWQWRFTKGQLTGEAAAKLAGLAELYKR